MIEAVIVCAAMTLAVSILFCLIQRNRGREVEKEDSNMKENNESFDNRDYSTLMKQIVLEEQVKAYKEEREKLLNRIKELEEELGLYKNLQAKNVYDPVSAINSIDKESLDVLRWSWNN